MSTRARSLLVLLLALLFTSLPGPSAFAARGDAPLLGMEARGVIPDQYIVVFRPGLSAQAASAIAQAVANGAVVHYTYTAALNGFAGTLPPQALAVLRRNPNVLFIEADREENFIAEPSAAPATATQTNATWGLDRIDQRDLPLNTTYTYNTTGSGVNAYVIDTGIRLSHTEFGGRALSGYTAINDSQGTNDCNGHGTHVAGTIGGTVYGVAKAVRLYAVRVLNCSGSGTTSGVIAGVDWVTANHVKPAAANMSLGGSASTALDSAVNNSINAGVTYAIAAGNSNANACNYSPARVAAAITAGATTSTDARSSFSNYGTCLDIFAPGSSITSAWNTSDTATNTISGTSMATPHVAGVAALYLQGNPGAAPSAVRDAIVNSSTPGKVTSAGTGSPNRLLYSLLTTAPTPTPTPPGPTATPTAVPPGAELIVNGGFEGSASPWVLSGNAYHSTGAYPHSGTGYTVLGYYNNASGTEYQQITIPGTATTANLTFWLNVTSSETTTTIQYDRLYVEVRSTSGALLATLATYSNLNKGTAGVYAQKGAFSLLAYKGQTVRVQFRATTDFSLATSFRVDDVSVK